MSLRRRLRRGSVSVDHSNAFRHRKALLLSEDEWACKRDQHLQSLSDRKSRSHGAGDVQLSDLLSEVDAPRLFVADRLGRLASRRAQPLALLTRRSPGMSSAASSGRSSA